LTGLCNVSDPNNASKCTYFQIRNDATGLCIESPVMGFMMYKEVSLKACSNYAFNQVSFRISYQ